MLRLIASKKDNLSVYDTVSAIFESSEVDLITTITIITSCSIYKHTTRNENQISLDNLLSASLGYTLERERDLVNEVYINVSI